MPKPQPIVIEGSPVVSALEDAWATIRHHHPELPEVVIVVGAESGTKQHPCATGTPPRRAGSATIGGSARSASAGRG